MPDTVLCIDMGTTNTRVWLVDRTATILHSAAAAVGARNTAQDGHNNLLRQTLHTLIHQLTAGLAPAAHPTHIAAAGMITSPQGLKEIPHIPAPAGKAELAAATRAHFFPDITDLPIHLVPGIKTPTDLMRGEETLVLGLLETRHLAPPATLLNLGSHWKAIAINSESQITACTTSLSGELMHAAQSATILKSALPDDRPIHLSPAFLDQGMHAARTAGLPRALFQVRLMQLANTTTPADRWSFTTGAFIATDLDALKNSHALTPPIHLTGHPALTQAWQHALTTVNLPSQILTPQTIEHATITALLALTRP